MLIQTKLPHGTSVLRFLPRNSPVSVEQSSDQREMSTYKILLVVSDSIQYGGTFSLRGSPIRVRLLEAIPREGDKYLLTMDHLCQHYSCTDTAGVGTQGEQVIP